MHKSHRRRSFATLMYAAFLAALNAAAPPAPHEVDFQKSQLKIAPSNRPGTEQLRMDKNILSWHSACPAAIELQLHGGGGKVDEFDHAQFKLRLNFPQPLVLKRIVLRLSDAHGEQFQFSESTTGAFPSGITELTYRVDRNHPKASIWGGDGNKTLDFPLRVSGIAIDTAPDTATNGQIELLSVHCRAAEQLSIQVDTGHPVHLLLSENAAAPRVCISNIGLEQVVLNGFVSVDDITRELTKTPVRLTIDPGKSETVPIAGDFSTQGIYQISCLLNSARGKAFHGTFRIGRMNPAGPTPGRAEEFLFGLCGHPERFSPLEAEREALAAGLCGAKIYRVDFRWPLIQPRPGEWDFSIFDRLTGAFGRNGVELQCLLGYDAPWAIAKDYQPKNSQLPRSPGLPDAALFAQYAGRVASRYADRIRYFEIWNEPDLTMFANFSAGQYMQLLRQSYDAIKRNAPKSVVMPGGIASVYTNAGGNPNHNNGLFELLAADGGRHFDIFAFHGHGSPNQYADALSVLKKHKLIGADAPRGWYSNETAETSVKIGEKRQAEYLFQKLLLAWSNGAIGYNWYLLREKGYFPVGHPERHFGLLTPDFEPKAGYITYNMLAKNYRGARFLRRIPFAPGGSALLFKGRAGERLLALWSSTPARPFLITGMPPGTVRIDLFGNETPIRTNRNVASVVISQTPITLKIPPSENGDPQIAPLLQALPPQLLLEPEKISQHTFTLANPSTDPIHVVWELHPPEHVSATPRRQALTIAPGATQQVQFNVAATSKFTATLTAAAKLQLKLIPEGMPAESADIALALQGKDNAFRFDLDRAEQYNTFIPSGSGKEAWYWQGPRDLSANVRLSREGNTLRLRAVVTDDIHVQPHRGALIWRGDSIQLALHIDRSLAKWKIGLAGGPDGKAQVFCWRGADGFVGPIPGIGLQVRRDEAKKQTCYDAAIPFHELGMLPADALRGFRFNLIVNDNDGDLREGYIAIVPTMSLDEESSETWPLIYFEEKKR